MFPTLDQEKIEVMKAAFEEADKDGKGKLSANQFKEVLKVVLGDYIDDEWTEMIMRVADLNRDGMLNYEELTHLFTANKEPGEEWKALFMMINANSDGKLCKRDIAKLMEIFDQDTEDEEHMMIIKTFDEDGDGLLNYEEFCKLMADQDPNDSR